MLHSPIRAHARWAIKQGRFAMTPIVKQFAASESGATSIEYALIAVLIALAIIVSLTAVGASLQSIFSDVASEVTTAIK
jgi:pilus assembly protein Flp/PilA